MPMDSMVCQGGWLAAGCIPHVMYPHSVVASVYICEQNLKSLFIANVYFLILVTKIIITDQVLIGYTWWCSLIKLCIVRCIFTICALLSISNMLLIVDMLIYIKYKTCHGV